jgi:hypothetical protein
VRLDDLRDLRDRQSGVLSRRQLIEAGATDNDVRRWVRRRELTRVHDGVFVDHTGPLTWVNRSWVAVLLLYWPAALSHDSVVHRAGDVIHVAVPDDRNVLARPGIKVHLLTRLAERVRWNLAPPRVRLEEAVLMMCAAQPSRLDALSLAADVCTRRRTTPERLLTELHRQSHLKHRAWLTSVLRETADGIRSALESSYLRRVERAHGLPRGTRQLRERTARGVVYRDIVYERFGVAVEPDGRVGHELSRDRWADMDRDLDAALTGLMTIRLGWRHAEDLPCHTARRLAALLQRHGWRGSVRPCSSDCAA